MFFYAYKYFINQLVFRHKFFFLLLINLLKFLHVPRFNNLALLNYANNFNYIVELAAETELPRKFIDFSLDACEFYFNQININSEILYYSNILLKTPLSYKTICLLSLLYVLWRD